MNDAGPGRAYSEQKDMERRLPMETGIINSAELFARFDLPQNTALCMIEPFQPACAHFGTLSPEEAVREAAAAFDRVVNK